MREPSFNISIPSEQDWTRQAECAKPYAPYMFPAEPDTKMVEAAKSVCKLCPVSEQCLGMAMKNGETYGIWGGLTASERRALARKQSTQRRKKKAASQ